RQSSDGSFGLWTAGPSGPPFVAIYAVHILTDLAEAGFQVPQDMLKSAFGFLQGFIAMPDTSIADARDKAYAMYVLQRNGLTVAAALPELIAALDKKHDKPSWKKGLTGAFIASIFQMLQAQSEADDSISKVEFGTDVKPDGARYFDGLRHDSQILYLMSRHFPNRAKALSSASLVKISEEIGAGMYTSQGAAQAILGIHAFAKIQGDIAAMSVTAEEIDSAGKATPLLLKGDKILSSPYSLSTAKVQFKTPANTPLFYQVEQTGFLRGTPPEGVAKHMEVFREFVDDKGATITTAKVGEVVNVRLKIRATDRDYVSGVSMIDLLPGGFEVEMSSKDRGGDSSSAGREAIENRDAGSGDSSIQDAGEGGRGEEGRGEGGGEGGEADEADRVRQAEEHGAAPVSGSSFVSQLGRGSWATEHADVREDRVIIYGSIRKTMSDFTYRARLTTKGVFAIPPVFAESMYERSVHATSKGGTFTVTD
ncbi:MAG: hypothetical protein NTV34_14400, partial [Proteobacteria bacterium]|nr:hypothetical protein [Pseudomonadota bacterium]